MEKVWAYQKPGMKMEIHGRAELPSLKFGLPRSDTQNRSQPLLQCTMQSVPLRYWSRSIVLHMPSDALRLHRLRTDQVLKAAAVFEHDLRINAPAQGLSATLLIIERGDDSPDLNCLSCVVVDHRPPFWILSV